MHKSFPFQCILSASLPTFRKGVHCTKAVHPLTHAVRAVQCAVRFSTLLVQVEPVVFDVVAVVLTAAAAAVAVAVAIVVVVVVVEDVVSGASPAGAAAPVVPARTPLGIPHWPTPLRALVSDCHFVVVSWSVVSLL